MGIMNVCCGITKVTIIMPKERCSFIICLCYWFIYSETVDMCPDSGTGSGHEVAEPAHPPQMRERIISLEMILVNFFIYHLKVVLRSVTTSSYVVNLA